MSTVHYHKLSIHSAGVSIYWYFPYKILITMLFSISYCIFHIDGFGNSLYLHFNNQVWKYFCKTKIGLNGCFLLEPVDNGCYFWSDNFSWRGMDIFHGKKVQFAVTEPSNTMSVFCTTGCIHSASDFSKPDA